MSAFISLLRMHRRYTFKTMTSLFLFIIYLFIFPSFPPDCELAERDRWHVSSHLSSMCHSGDDAPTEAPLRATQQRQSAALGSTWQEK